MGDSKTEGEPQASRLRLLGVFGGIVLVALGTTAAWALEKRSAAVSELTAEREQVKALRLDLAETREELSRAQLKAVHIVDVPGKAEFRARAEARTASHERLKKAHTDLHVHLKSVAPGPAQSAAVAGLEQAQAHERELSQQLDTLQTDLSVAQRNSAALSESLSSCERKLRYGQKEGAGSVQSQAVQAPGMERAPHIKVLKADPSHVIREVEPSNSARDTQ